MDIWNTGAVRSAIRLLRLQNVISPRLGRSPAAQPSSEPALPTQTKLNHFETFADTTGSPRTQDQSPAQLPLQHQSQHCSTSDQSGSPRTQDQSPSQLPLQHQSQHCSTSDQSDLKKVEEDRKSWGSLPYIVIGTGIGAVAAPVALTAVGFTGAGIAAGSVAASMMKASAIFYGGGVPAGGAVAILQSLGATMGGSYLGAAVGCATGATRYFFKRIKSGDGKDTSKEQ